MISKDKLQGKYITFIDKSSKFRTQKVTKITGNTITVTDALGIKQRLHPNKIKILGRQLKGELEEIKW